MASNKVVLKFIADVEGMKKGISQVNSQLSTFGRTIKGLGIGIGAAFSVQGIIQGLKDVSTAALEDESSLVALQNTLRNLGLASRDAGIEAFLGQLSLVVGVTDDELRPAFARLIRSTEDVAKAQQSLQLALDISAATGKDLDTVATGLGKAWDGNAASLGRLGLGIDKAVLASGDMELITAELTRKFQGQASAAANTYQGQIRRLTVAVDEAKESIGYALLNALDKVAKAMGGVGGLQTGIQQVGTGFAGLIDQVSDLITKIALLNRVTEENAKQDQYSEDAYRGLVYLLPVVGFWLSQASFAHEDAARAAGKAQAPINALAQRYQGLADAATRAAFAQRMAFEASRATTAESDRLTALAMQKYGKYLDFTGGTLEEWKKALHDTTAAMGSASRQSAQTFKVNWASIAKTVNESLDAISIGITGTAVTIKDKQKTILDQAVSNLKDSLASQIDTIKQGYKEIASYAEQIVGTVMGQIDLADFIKYDDNNKNPKFLIDALFGDLTNRQTLVNRLAPLATLLPEALTKQILALKPDAALAVINYFTANPAALAQLKRNYDALATQTATLLGQPMALAFAKVGNESAVTMITTAKAQIAKDAEDFSKWVKKNLNTTVTVKIKYVEANQPPAAVRKGAVVIGSINAYESLNGTSWRT